MFEVVKEVNGHPIWRMVGTRGHYTVHLDAHHFKTFRTIKAAAAFCESL